MFFPEGQVRVHLYGKPVVMRRSFDGLYALRRQELGEDPMSGSLYAFINRRGTQMKVLYWDRSGFCVWAKRQIFGIYAKIFQRAGSASKQKMIDKALVIPSEESELIGKRKGCQEVLNR